MIKRIFKIFAHLLGILAVLFGSGLAYIYLRGIPKYAYSPTPEIAGLKVEADSMRVARGAKIASLLCNECHKDPATGKLSGRPMPDVPKAFGKIVSLNITADPIHGIGNWTDGELYYLLRTGIHPDGRWSPPFMPKFPLMADEDVYSIIAWLRSDDPLLAASPQEYPANEFNLFTKFLSNIAIFPPPLPQTKLVVPDSTDKIAYGKYVADALLACYGCHSADFAKQDPLFPEKSFGYYGGGNPMLNFEGELVPSANITMDKETGIGLWTYEQFRDAVQFGKNPKGGPLYYPMFPHTTLTETELSGIWAYLQTVPTIKNPVNRYTPKD